MNTPLEWSKPLDRPSPAKVRLFLTESEADKVGLGDRWRMLQRKKGRRQAAQSEFAALVAGIRERQSTEGWSERQLTNRLGFPRTTWGRLLRGGLPAAEWLPRLRSAAARLQA